MLHTLLRLLHLVQLAVAYNLIIDTQTKAVTSYIHGFRAEFATGLENHAIATIRKKRCLGRIEVTDVHMTEVDVDSVLTVVADGDYYMRVEHLRARLHGNYRTNVLFIENTGDFQMDLSDLNATLGPLVPVNIGGIPYINQEVSCSIWHRENNVDLSGGILWWLARKRLRDTMKEDLEGVLCNSLVEILDRKIRKTLTGLNFVAPVNEATNLNYLLNGQPLLLPHGAIRTYHFGVTTATHRGAKFVPTHLQSNHHVIYHIHERLLTEVVQSACSRGFIDGNITSSYENVHVACQKATMSVKNMEAMNTATLLLALLMTFEDGSERQFAKNYTVSILHSSHLRLLFRLKSEIVDPNERFPDYSDEIFLMISEVMRSHVSVPLPTPAGTETDRAMIKLLPDRIIFATDFVFRGR